MRTTIVCLTLVAIAGLVAGCPKTVNTVRLDATGGYNWVVTDPILGDGCAVTSASKRFENDILRVQVTVENLRDEQQVFQYQFTFYDQDGMKIHSSTAGWERKFIPARGSIDLGQVAPDSRARSVKLELKRPNRE